MIRTIKIVLPILVFIILSAGAVGLWTQLDEFAVLGGGLSVALVISLLLYAVIRWDDAIVIKEQETRQLASVVNHAMDAIVIADTQGRILYANTAANECYNLCEVTKATVADIGLDPRLQQEAFGEVSQGHAWNGEVSHTAGDGRVHTYLNSIFLLDSFKDASPAFVSIGRDLSHRKELERKLMHSQRLAAVGELAAGVAHEINNPIAAIQSQIGLAKDIIELSERTPGNTTESQILSCIDDAAQQVERCGQIIESLLRFSRRQEPKCSATVLPDVIHRSVDFLRSLPKMSRLKFNVELPDDLPEIHSDANSISQILVNLMLNSADASQHEGTICVRAYTDQTGTIGIDVVDWGCGLNAEVVDRVFEPFFTTKSPGHGTGLGLSISYGLAQSLNGTLALSPGPSGETIATLTLPVK